MRPWNRDLNDKPRPTHSWDGIQFTERDRQIAHEYLNDLPHEEHTLAALLAWVRMLPSPSR